MDPGGREATVMSIENMEIYKLQGGGPTELRPCGSIKRNESVPIDHDTASQPHRFRPIRLHPGWCRQCKEYLLFVFSITVIAKVFVVLYVIWLNLRVRVRFDLKSRFSNSGIYDLFGETPVLARSPLLTYRTSLFLFGCTVHTYMLLWDKVK